MTVKLSCCSTIRLFIFHKNFTIKARHPFETFQNKTGNNYKWRLQIVSVQRLFLCADRGRGFFFLVKGIINTISETTFNFLLKSFFMFTCVNITGLHTSPSHNTAKFNKSKSGSGSFSLFWTTLNSYERLIWINWQMCRVPLSSGSCLWAFHQRQQLQ